MFLKRRPILFLILPLVVVMSSCLKGDLEDLEKQLTELEKALGSNEPLVLNLSTTDDGDVPIVKNAAFLFKGSDENDNAMYDYGDGYYYVYVERALDVGFDEYLEVGFYYDANTNTAEDGYVYMSWYDRNYNRINPEFYEGASGTTFELKINSINVETGQVSFTVTAATDETASYNEYFQKPMDCTVSFNGTLGIFLD
jgi:hypothetical protein